MNEVTAEQIALAIQTRCPECKAVIGRVCEGGSLAHKARLWRAVVKDRMTLIECEAAA